LSFITSPLNGVTVLDAQLHLNQVSPNPVAALGPCRVDIINGFFGADYHLSGVDDFSGNTDTSKPNVTQIPPLASDALTNWVIAPLNPTGVANINRGSTNTGRTQFRIHFDPTLTINNQQAGWNSGDATNYPPQLGVQYQP
jgi:hypothetical protein